MNREPKAARKGGLSANWAVREVDHLFSRFARYSRVVVYSKWFLGVFALLLLSLLMLWPVVTKDKSGMRISFVGSGAKTGPLSASPTMESPVYEGVDKKGQQFKISGRRAVQASPELVVIEQMQGQLLTGDSFISLTANRADYRKEQNRIDLVGEVNVIHGAGYSFVTDAAVINTETMDVAGTLPVSGEGPMGNLLATGFQIRDNGNRVLFGGTGRVNVVIEKARNAS